MDGRPPGNTGCCRLLPPSPFAASGLRPPRTPPTPPASPPPPPRPPPHRGPAGAAHGQGPTPPRHSPTLPARGPTRTQGQSGPARRDRDRDRDRDPDAAHAARRLPLASASSHPLGSRSGDTPALPSAPRPRRPSRRLESSCQVERIPRRCREAQTGPKATSPAHRGKTPGQAFPDTARFSKDRADWVREERLGHLTQDGMASAFAGVCAAAGHLLKPGTRSLVLERLIHNQHSFPDLSLSLSVCLAFPSRSPLPGVGGRGGGGGGVGGWVGLSFKLHLTRIPFCFRLRAVLPRLETLLRCSWWMSLRSF